MIPAHQARRIDDVGVIKRVENVVNRHARSQHLRWIYRHVKFRLLPSLHDDPGHAAQAIEARFDVVRRQFPQIRLGNLVRCQAIADDRKTREIHPVGFDLGCGRKAALDT